MTLDPSARDTEPFAFRPVGPGDRRSPSATLVAALLAALMVVTVVRCRGGRRGHRHSRLAATRLASAARAESRFAEHRRVEQRVIALLHDTVLGDLAAIGALPPGELPPLLDRQLRQNVGLLASDRWMGRLPPGPATVMGAAVGHARNRDAGVALLTGGYAEPPAECALFRAVAEAHADGFVVTYTGDPSATGRVSGEVAQALGLAVAQCLSNVRRHSGQSAAEVSVQADPRELLVMVVDTGKGFREAEVAPDRLGLRTSVRARVAAVGGSVTIWSTEGLGTSVIIRVPVLIEAEGAGLVAGTLAPGDPRMLSGDTRQQSCRGGDPDDASCGSDRIPADTVVDLTGDLRSDRDAVRAFGPSRTCPDAAGRRDRSSILRQEVVPFFSAIVARGWLAPADPGRARALAGLLRDLMVAEVDHTWLDALAVTRVTGRPVPLTINDDDQLASMMDLHQRIALRALLDLLTDRTVARGSSCGVVVALQRSGSGAAGSVTASGVVRGRIGRASAPHLDALRSVFPGLDVAARGTTLTVRFEYEND